MNAILPLSGSNLIAVPVKVIVETMIVKTINNEGLFNIFVDPLDDAPFGRRNTVSTNIKQTVQATFVNNSDVIELVLNYSRVGVKLDFNGNTYVDGTATIGNDFGDYQPITDGIISINIVQRQIEQVYANMYNSLGVLVQVSIFEATYVDVTDPVTGELLYQDITKTIGNDSEIDDIGVLYYDNSPSSIFVKFTGLSELIEIQPRKENSLGLCYEGLSGDDPVIKIINIIPAFLDAEGEDTVFINNPEENIDAVELEDVYGSLILTSTEPESTYSGSFVDNGLDVLDIIKSYFLDEEIQIGDGFINSTYVTEENEDVSLYYEFYYFQSDTEYETYHLVDDGFGNIRPINEDDDHIIPAYVEEVTEDYYMNAGVYVIRAYVRGNTQYGGYDEVLFRIYPRDYTNNIVMTLVNGEIDTSPEALDPDDPLGDIGTVNALISLEYRGTPYVVNARIGTGYASMTKFLPVYPDGEAPVDVGTYIITFILQTEDGIINDICTNSVTLTIEKTTLDEIPYRAGSEGVPEIIANDEEFVELELNESTDLSIVYAEENVANYVLNVYGVSIPFVYSIYTDYDCTNTIVGSIYAQNVGKYYLKIEEIDNNNYTLNAKFEIEVENASMNVEEDIDYSVDNVSGTQIPDHHLTIYGVIVTDFTNCPIEYYTAGGGVIVPNITTAIPGNYESRITINIPNYEPVTITATFVKS